MNMLGQDIPCDAIPWFWSGQYNAKRQIAGLDQDFDRVVSRDGACSLWYYRDKERRAVDAFNDPAAFMAAKRLCERRKYPPWR